MNLKRFLIIALLTGFFTPSIAFGEEEGHGEAHHSLLHILFKIPVVERLVPQPGKQPDLVLNTFFLIAVLTVCVVLVTRKLQRLPEAKGQNLIEFVVEQLVGREWEAVCPVCWLVLSRYPPPQPARSDSRPPVANGRSEYNTRVCPCGRSWSTEYRYPRIRVSQLSQTLCR